jgi:hypothetical protein
VRGGHCDWDLLVLMARGRQQAGAWEAAGRRDSLLVFCFQTRRPRLPADSTIQGQKAFTECPALSRIDAETRVISRPTRNR